MKMKITLLFIAIALMFCLQQTILLSNSAAPPTGYTGASGTTCTSCHTVGVTAASISYTITYAGNNNAVNNYHINNTYNITVTVSGSSNPNPKYGFAMRAQDGSGTSRGTWTIGSNTGITGSEIHHINASGMTSSWTFQWTAPPTNYGNITFYVAGNYGDGDGTSNGDAIATTSFVLKPTPIISPVANVTPATNDTFCINIPVTLTNSSTGAIKAYSMYFGALPTIAAYGTPPASFSHTYTATGTYLVTYIVSTDSPMTGQNGTIDTFTKTITIINYPDPTTVASVNPACSGLTDTLKLTHKLWGATYTPNFGTATAVGSPPNGGPYPIILPATYGQYHFSMSATGYGCTSPPYYDSVLISSCTPPQAQFNLVDSSNNLISNICYNTGYYFQDVSQQGSSSIITWQWNFNAGGNTPPPVPFSATGVGPHHIVFPAGGVYTISLKVTDAQGQTNTHSSFVTVNQNCGPHLFIACMNPYLPQDTCTGDSILFSDISNQATYAWRWNWGDGSPIDTVPSMWHHWANYGNYTITFAAKDVYGTWDTVYNSIVIGSAPPAAAGRDTLICTGNCVSIGSPAVNGAVYHWTSSPPGFVSTNAHPSVCPTVTTTYYLMAANAAGNCAKFDTVKITVDSPPNVVLTASSPIECVNNDDTITATPSNLGFYSFTFPNGGGIISGTGGGPYVVSWSTASTNVITCNVHDANGCISTVTPVTVITQSCNPPTAKFVFTPNPACLFNQVSMTDSSTGNPTNWFWQFGNGATPVNTSQQNPFVTYNTTGQHIISLTVSNAGGSSVYTDTIMVYNAPTAVFNFITPVCVGYNTIVSYLGNATPSAAYNWGFSGANVVSGTGQGPYYINWNSPGNKILSLQVTENGCSATSGPGNQVNVLPLPQVHFTYNVLTGTAYTTFTPTTTGATSYHWAFGDGSTSIIQYPPTHNYLHNGTYTVTLTVDNGYCAVSDTQIVVIDGLTGIDDLTASPNGLIVYHNDVAAKLLVEWTANKELSKQIQVINIKGDVVHQNTFTTDNTLNISTSQMVPGMYLLRVAYADGSSEMRKWIKN